MQTTAIRTVANSLPENGINLLILFISDRYIPHTDLMKKADEKKNVAFFFHSLSWPVCLFLMKDRDF